MKNILFLFLFFIIACLDVTAVGIGVSPGKLSFGEIKLGEDYEKELIILNPNDFGVEFNLKMPVGVEVIPSKGKIDAAQTRRLVLKISFNEKLAKEKENLVLEIKKMAAGETGALGMLPAVAVKLNYNYSALELGKNVVNNKLTGNSVAVQKEIDELTETGETETNHYGKTSPQKLKIFNALKEEIKENKLLGVELIGIMLAVVFLIGLVTYPVVKKRMKKERKGFLF